MRKEHAREGVLWTQRDGQVLAHRDEVRKLDRRLYGDQEAIHPVFAKYPGIDFVAARAAPPIYHFRPMAQHPPDQPSLAPHPPDSSPIARQWHSLNAEG